MTRKFKALGIALVAVFALSAMMASAAVAGTHEMEVEGGGTAELTATSHENTKDKFTVNTILGPGNVECHAKYSATVANGAKEVTIKPTYENCEAFGNPAEVKMNTCDYLFKNGATSAGGHAPVEVKCGATPIEIVVASIGCTLTVGAQTELTNGVHYTNVTTAGKPMEVTLHATVGNIKITGKDGSCGLVSGNVGTYTATETIKGYSDAGHTNQIGITAKEV